MRRATAWPRPAAEPRRRSAIQAEPSGSAHPRRQLHLAVERTRVGADGGVARRAQRAGQLALDRHAEERVGVGDPGQPSGIERPRPSLERQRPLSGGGHQTRRARRRPRRRGPAVPSRPCRARARRIPPRQACAAGCRRCRARATIRRSSRTRAHLGRPSQAAGADPGAGGQVASVGAPQMASRGSARGGIATSSSPRRQLGGDVLGRVHGDVDRARRAAPARAPRPSVTCRPAPPRSPRGGDRDELALGLKPLGHRAGLRERQRAPARSDPHQRRRSESDADLSQRLG